MGRSVGTGVARLAKVRRTASVSVTRSKPKWLAR